MMRNSTLIAYVLMLSVAVIVAAVLYGIYKVSVDEGQPVEQPTEQVVEEPTERPVEQPTSAPPTVTPVPPTPMPPTPEPVFDLEGWSGEAVGAFLASENVDTEDVDIRDTYSVFFDKVIEAFEENRCQEEEGALADLIDDQASSYEDPHLARFQIASILAYRIEPNSESDCGSWLNDGEYKKDME